MYYTAQKSVIWPFDISLRLFSPGPSVTCSLGHRAPPLINQGHIRCQRVNLAIQEGKKTQKVSKSCGEKTNIFIYLKLEVSTCNQEATSSSQEQQHQDWLSSGTRFSFSGESLREGERGGAGRCSFWWKAEKRREASIAVLGMSDITGGSRETRTWARSRVRAVL